MGSRRKRAVDPSVLAPLASVSPASALVVGCYLCFGESQGALASPCDSVVSYSIVSKVRAMTCSLAEYLSREGTKDGCSN